MAVALIEKPFLFFAFFITTKLIVPGSVWLNYQIVYVINLFRVPTLDFIHICWNFNFWIRVRLSHELLFGMFFSKGLNNVNKLGHVQQAQVMLFGLNTFDLFEIVQKILSKHLKYFLVSLILFHDLLLNVQLLLSQLLIIIFFWFVSFCFVLLKIGLDSVIIFVVIHCECSSLRSKSDYLVLHNNY